MKSHWIETLEIVKVTKRYNTSQLARELGIAQPTLWRYLNGQQTPKPALKTLLMHRLKQIIKA